LVLAGVSAGVKKANLSEGRMNQYPQIVERFVRIARANFGNVVCIDDLCRLAGANPRTISRAFKVVHDTTPSRYLRELRLMEVRRVLLSGCNRASITQVATRFGFRELGRFSVLYRNRFGEAPSVTNDLSISRHDPLDATQGAGRVDFVDVDRPSKVTHRQRIPIIRVKMRKARVSAVR
jgi:transcriptional regulator GlxA family with amidase domain